MESNTREMKKIYLTTANGNEIIGKNLLDRDLKDYFICFEGGRNAGKIYKSEMNKKEILINYYGVDEKTAEIVGRVVTTSGVPFENVIEAITALNEPVKQMTTSLKDALQNISEIDNTKRIADLEKRKKHCKNYLELKQINRELQELKFKSNVRRYRKH